MAGFPGSGKSTLARIIGTKTGAIVIDHDIVKSALMEALKDNEMNLNTTGKISYHIEWSLIDYHLSQGNSVIFDSPCFFTEMVEKGLSLANKHRAHYKYVECYLNNLTEINDRLKNREKMISQINKVESQKEFLAAIENSKRPLNIEYLVIDSGQPLDSYIYTVLEYISR